MEKYFTREDVERQNLKEGDLVEIVFDECPIGYVYSGIMKRFPRDAAVGYYVGLDYSNIQDEASVILSTTLKKNPRHPRPINQFIIRNGICHITKLSASSNNVYETDTIKRGIRD